VTISTAAKIDLARKMREEPTFWEYLLWMKLRRRQFGVTFHQQRRLLGYIVDFWCPAARIVVEVDGNQHQQAEAIAYDAERDAAFDARGIMTLRFSNEDVENGLPLVLKRIRSHTEQRKSLKGFDSKQAYIQPAVTAVRSEDSENAATFTPTYAKSISTVVENRTGEVVSPQEIAELQENFKALVRKTAMTPERQDSRSYNERAWEQRRKLSGWIQQRRTA
jgi:very-short-patch-repair endonuclease